MALVNPRTGAAGIGIGPNTDILEVLGDASVDKASARKSPGAGFTSGCRGSEDRAS